MKRPARSKTPQKILYVENGIGYGGAVICLRHLVRNLDRQRFEPIVVTGRTGKQYREIASETKWKYIADHNINLRSAAERLRSASWIRKVPGLKMLLDQILGRLDDLINFLPFFTRLLIFAISLRPGIIHANNEPLCNRASLLVAKLLRIPSICHVRGTPEGSRMMKWFYCLPGHFIPVSNWISAGVQKLGVPAEKCTVIYDGINLSDMDVSADGRSFRLAHKVPEGAFAVGLVGLLIPWKGQQMFIDAAHILKDEIPNLRMLIIGGTPADCLGFERELRDRVCRECLEQTVIFTGHQDHLALVYNGLDVVVSASVVPEPLGIVALECMAMARPLVAPRHGGAVEVTEHRRTALLFEPGNAKSLAECIGELYRTPELRQELGRAGREKALANFSVSECIRRTQEVYQMVLSRRILNSLY